MSHIPEQRTYKLNFTPSAFTVYQAHAQEQVELDFSRQRQPRSQYVEVIGLQDPSTIVESMVDVRLVVSELQQFSDNTRQSAVRLFDQSPTVPVAVSLMEQRQSQGSIAAKLASKLAFHADVIETMGEL